MVILGYVLLNQTKNHDSVNIADYKKEIEEFGYIFFAYKLKCECCW